MAETQNVNLKPISSEEKTADLIDLAALEKTPEERKKVRSVGFYELDVLRHQSEDGETTNSITSDVTEGEDKKDLEDQDNEKDGQPQESKEAAANYYDQDVTPSPKSCRKHSAPTCLCKECVENYMNLCETHTHKPIPADEEKRETTTSSLDSSSQRSRSDSETSRHTNSSGDDFVGTQVTLPYPDKNGPPECIARLSNAGLYDPSEDPPVRAVDEDNISQVVINTAFFVEHPAPYEQKKNVQLDLCDKVDIEKGDPETEPLMRINRRSLEKEPVHPGCCQCHRVCLKIVGSFVLAMVIFPAFLYGAYAWLPFDAPMIPDVPTRLVYTLRCSAFASFPIVLGVIVHGISRLCASSYDPFQPREREVTIHRRFVKQSTFLFVLFFFNLSVLATYLPQEQLKFIPLLTCLFCLSQ
ncbi:hypothetical protein GDO81_029653 [Engystomops pustulosus]|nr:hypothetical protein GDO81_029653 [Engystomops pustulosus]